MRKLFFVNFLVLCFAVTTLAQNPSQWRGPFRNGIYPGEELKRAWPDDGPSLLWSVDSIGEGFAAATASENMIFVTGLMDSLDVLTALDRNGKLLWRTAFGNGWIWSFPGTRSSVTFRNDSVFAISATGEVVCLDARNGNILWKLDAYNIFKGKWTMWGTSESPLLVDDKIIYTPGGDQTTMVALDAKDGTTVWQTSSLGDSTAYVSPLYFEHYGRRIIASVLANSFFGVDAEDGEILWRYNYKDLKWKQDHWYSPIININTPVYSDGQIFISKGYDHKSAMFKLNEDGSDIELMWTDTILDVHLGGMVFYDGYLYGSNWIHNRAGNWCCLDWKTGELMYETEWFNKGAIIMADDHLICIEEKDGHVGLVKPDPNRFEPISSFRVEEGRGPYWAHPVVDKGLLLIRHGQVLLAYDIGR